MKRLTVVAALLSAACAAKVDRPTTPQPPRDVVVATFTGTVDPANGIFEIRTEPTGAGLGLGMSRISVIPDGGAGGVSVQNSPSDVLHKCVTGEEADCSSNPCGTPLPVVWRKVTVSVASSNYPTLVGAWAGITEFRGDSGAVACNGMGPGPAVFSGFPSSHPWDLGSLGSPAGFPDDNEQDWAIRYTAGAAFTFTGEVHAFVERFRTLDGAAGFAPNRMPHPVYGVPTVATGFFPANNVFYASADRGKFVVMDGSSPSSSAEVVTTDPLLSGKITSFSYNGSPAVLWVATDAGEVATVDYATGAVHGKVVFTLDGETVSSGLTVAAVGDGSRHAWVASRDGGYIQRVVADISTLSPSIDAASKTTVPTPEGIAFAEDDAVQPTTSYALFVTTGINDKILSYLPGPVGEAPTPSTEYDLSTPCRGPVEIIRRGGPGLGELYPLWFTARTSNRVCFIDYTNFSVSAFPIPVGTVTGLAEDADHRVWVVLEDAFAAIQMEPPNFSTKYQVVGSQDGLEFLGIAPINGSWGEGKDLLWIITNDVDVTGNISLGYSPTP
jgi:hypothetical protein